MKKKSLFILSVLTAIVISYYNKKTAFTYGDPINKNQAWKTFEIKKNQQIDAHNSTSKELAQARISNIKREISQQKDQTSPSVQSSKTENVGDNKNINFLYREDRVLIGGNEIKNYQDEKLGLEMINTPNKNWKEFLGNELIRFQNEETKVMIKKEHSIIKIQNTKGQYLEQVMITYLLKNGRFNSFRALIDSETGSVLETWDKTIHENSGNNNAHLVIPIVNESGIITK